MILSKTKLNRLKSVVNQVVRSSTGRPNEFYMIDPFYHYAPEYEIQVDLIHKTFVPDLEGDDVEKYYKAICDWFHEVLPKEGIPIEVIDKAILNITPEKKECIIEAQGRKFSAYVRYKK